MKNLLTSFFVLITCTVFGQATHKVEAFSTVDVSTGIKATLVRSKEYKVVISGDDVHNIVVKSSKGKLSIRRQTTKALNGKHCEATIYYVDPITKVVAYTDAHISSEEVFKQAKIEVEASTAGFVHLYLDTDFASSSIATGGQIQLNGTTKNLYANIHTGGQFNGLNLSADTATLSVTAGGTIEANVSGFIKANVSMGGTILYKGGAEVESKTSMGGSIRELDK